MIRRRRDLFGVVDILAVNGAEMIGCLGVQATSDNGGNHSAHVKKAIAEPQLRAWLEAGNRFEVWSWKKSGARGKAKRWGVRMQSVKLEELGPCPKCGQMPGVHAEGFDCARTAFVAVDLGGGDGGSPE